MPLRVIIIDPKTGKKFVVEKIFNTRAEVYKFLIMNSDKIPKGIVRIVEEKF